MINNNPYIVPEKPLKQSKVAMQPVPLFPHQINRRNDDMDFKHHSQMLKRSTLPVFFETSIKQVSRIPLSPQTVLKGHPLQVSTVNPWENNRQQPNSLHFRELNQRINAMCERLDSQQRRIMAMFDAKKQEHSTTLSDSTTHTYQPGNLFISKQMERYSQFEASCQNSTELVQKLRQEISGLKFQREKYELDFKEHFASEMKEQKQAITQQLISNFRESLNQKFAQEGQKINESIRQISRLQDKKIESAIAQIKKQLNNQIKLLRQQFKQLEIREKPQGMNFQLRQKLEKIKNSIYQLRADHLGFKDHVFKSILTTHHHEQQMTKLKDRISLLSVILEKKQVSNYEGFINISSQKSQNQIIRLSLQSYMTAINHHQNIKLKVNQCNYYIDTDGYLLDAHGYYILNSKNMKIKIEQTQIRKLKEMGILQ